MPLNAASFSAARRIAQSSNTARGDDSNDENADAESLDEIYVDSETDRQKYESGEYHDALDSYVGEECKQRAHQYFRVRGGISDTSTGSNSKRGSSASAAKYAFVVFSQFWSSRSGNSGL